MKSKLLLLLFLAAWTSPVYASRYVPGEVIAVFKSSGNRGAGVSACAASIGASVKKTYASLSAAGAGEFVLLHSGTKSEHDLLEELRARPDVMAVSLNYKRKVLASSYMPNDKYAERLWGMTAIRANELWSRDITGSPSVYAAVIDTGAEMNHEDLRANISAEYSRNILDGSKNYGDINTLGHGTHIAGIIGAVGNNGTGVAGVNWNAGIIVLKGSDGMEVDDSDTIAALDYVLDLLDQGVNIASVNMSFGSWQEDTPAQMQSYDPLYRAMYQVSRTNKTILCVAAGNEEQAVGYPAPCDGPVYKDEEGEYTDYMKGDYCYPASFIGLDNMIVVSSANMNLSRDTEYSHSNYNADIAAPGALIVSTTPNDYELLENEEVEEGVNNYAAFSGTSMATPHAAGAAALLKSVYPSASARQIKKAILSGANRSY